MRAMSSGLRPRSCVGTKWDWDGIGNSGIWPAGRLTATTARGAPQMVIAPKPLSLSYLCAYLITYTGVFGYSNPNPMSTLPKWKGGGHDEHSIVETAIRISSSYKLIKAT